MVSVYIIKIIETKTEQLDKVMFGQQVNNQLIWIRITGNSCLMNGNYISNKTKKRHYRRNPIVSLSKYYSLTYGNKAI